MDRTGLPELTAESKLKFHRKLAVVIKHPFVMRTEDLDDQQAAVQGIVYR